MQHLHFGLQFNHSLVNLPNKLTRLTIDANFASSIDTFPPSLTRLEVFAKKFEELITKRKTLNQITPFLNHLFVSDYINLDLLPESLSHLTIYGSAQKRSPVLNHLPASLTHLKISGKWSAFQGSLPRVTHLSFEDFNAPVSGLPDSITHLTFGDDFKYPIDTLPNSITHLTFEYKFNNPIYNFPHSLTHLTFGDFFNCAVSNYLPSSITHLKFGRQFDRDLDTLPHSLTHITVGPHFTQTIDHLPPHLTFFKVAKLGLFSEFDQFVNHLPQKLTHLYVGDSFNKPVANLPATLKLIKFGHKFNQSIAQLPSGVEVLGLGSESSRLPIILPPISEFICVLRHDVRNYNLCLPPTIRILCMKIDGGRYSGGVSKLTIDFALHTMCYLPGKFSNIHLLLNDNTCSGVSSIAATASACCSTAAASDIPHLH